MVDIGNSAFTPQPVDIVLNVKNLQQVVGGLLVSNPLTNAVTTSGLAQWLGHYGGMFLWIGEFLPGDPNFLNPDGSAKPQRGISMVRDDAKAQSAFAMYDWDPYTGGPLRQKIRLGDADGRIMLQEGESGGWGWPRLPIAMANVGTGWYTNNVDAVQMSGRSQIVGRHVDFFYWINSVAVGIFAATNAGLGNVPIPLPLGGNQGGTTLATYVEVDVGTTVINSTTQTLGGGSGGFFSGTVDLGASWKSMANDFMVINLHAWFSVQNGGATQNALNCQPIQFHNYTQWTNRQTDGI